MIPPWRASGPEQPACPLLLTSPHSGTHMPAPFLAATSLPRRRLRQFEDAHVGALLEGAVAAGMPLVEATHARAFLDLNRDETELDRSMFAGALDLPVRPTNRVRAGYGVIPRQVGPEVMIYRDLLPAAEARRRIHGLHRPWHQELARRLDAIRAQHGAVVLLDCHSMPSLPTISGPPAQVVIGDLHGQSAAPPLSDALHRLLLARGFRVARNQPYAGGYTTRRHAAPTDGIHVLQLEIDRALYMDQETLRPRAAFPAMVSILAGVLGSLAAEAHAMLPLLRPGGKDPLLLAAE
ncbi:MAG: N-formylglutamate amidohydrolase [Thermaurantiacus sp.]